MLDSNGFWDWEVGLPEAYDNSRIDYVHFFDMDVRCLPAEIGRLTSLKDLYISGNQISSLPPKFAKLTALDWLDLNNNRLCGLPDSVIAMITVNGWI